MAAGVRITGLNETVRALTRLGVDSADLRDTFTDLAKEGKAKARALAPRKSGKLQRMITSSRSKNKATIRVLRKERPYHYAPFVHFGQRSYAGVPFLFQAVDQMGESYIRAQVDLGLNRAIKRAGL